MKTDKFMQGILVSDEDDVFTYGYTKHYRGITQVVHSLKRNLTGFRHPKHSSASSNHNKEAVFSRGTVEGSVDEAVTDMWFRLRIKPEPDQTDND